MGKARALKRLFIVAGEASGDALGGALVHDLGLQGHRFDIDGVGGEKLVAEGMNVLFPMSELAVMGFVDVLARLPGLLARVRRVADAIARTRPAVAILIDNQVFSAMVARRLRRQGYDLPLLLYVAPSVWAWKPERARKLYGLFNEILAVLPFEPRVFTELGGPKTTYVGHPSTSLPRLDLRSGLADRPVVALLPGSRKGELRRHLPLFGEVAAELARRHAGMRFVLPTLDALAGELRAAVENWPVDVEVVSAAARELAYQTADAALASSGTVTLELAMRGIPHVGAYVPDWLQMRAYIKAGRPRILLPNIVLDQDLVPEVPPGNNYAARLVSAMQAILQPGPGREAQLAGFAKIRDLMTKGEKGTGVVNAASRVLAYL